MKQKQNNSKDVKIKHNFNTGEFISENEIVLQIPRDEELCNIEAGLSTIQGKYISFSVVHPKCGFKGKDPKTVFNQGTKSVGTMGDTWIAYTGWPKLKAKILIPDPKIKVLIKQDKVLLSYAFWRDSSPSSFDFDHLLIYPRKGGL
jgi:hypothetical protein